MLFIVATQGASGDARAPVGAMTVRSIAAPVAEPVELARPESRVPELPARAERAVPTPEAAPQQAPVDAFRETRGLAASSPSTGSEPTIPFAAPTPLTREMQSLLSTPAESQNAVASLPAAPDYLMGARLDSRPQPIGEIEPEYPDSGQMREGAVVLRILIDETGHVDNVAVVRATPQGAFEEAAIEAFAQASFTPGRAAGVPVKSQMTVEVRFTPINRGARISGRGY